MQFRLRTLLLLFVVAWSSMAAFGLWGLVLGVSCIVVVTVVRVYLARRPPRQKVSDSTSLYQCFLVVIVVGVLAGLLLPTLDRSRGDRHPYHANVKQIVLGLLLYDEAHGHFPPAYIADEDGKPAHSWRVLILPYLGEQELYERYDFSEPWNGPNNRQLAKHIPKEYRLPGVSEGPPNTYWVAVTGPRTVWPGSKSIEIADILDGCSNTIMLVEIGDGDFHWMEPRDLTLDEILSGDACTGHRVESGHFQRRVRITTGCCVGFVDGHSRYMRCPTPEAWESLLTIDDGKQLDSSQLHPQRIVKTYAYTVWPRCIGLALFLLSMILLLARPLPKKWIGSTGKAFAECGIE